MHSSRSLFLCQNKQKKHEIHKLLPIQQQETQQEVLPPEMYSSMLHIWILACTFFSRVKNLFSHRPNANACDFLLFTGLAEAHLLREVKKFHPLMEDLGIPLS